MKFVKAIVTLIVILLLALVWWSSTLIEEDLKHLQADIRRLQKETEALSQKLGRMTLSSGSMAPTASVRPHIDNSYPNLLEIDEYYTSVLPALLGNNFVPKGVRKEALVGRPENLHPFNGFRDVSLMHAMCTPSLATLQLGKFETIAPDLALKIEARPRDDLPSI